jgi:hypothetical protein
MEEIENILNKIQNYLGNSTDNLKILEEQIDISLQMEYYKLSGKVKTNINKEKILSEKEKLFDKDISLNIKKNLLCKLASIEDVSAYRTIEKFLEEANEEIYKWAFLAFQESKMLLESSFLDENVVFISTGLGGKAGKLRYHIVFYSETIPVLNDLHLKIVKNEVSQVFKQFNCVDEKIEMDENLCSITALVPLNVDLKKVFDKILGECNLYGNFLNPGFIISNVKILKKDEIRNIIIDKISPQNEIIRIPKKLE